MMKAMRKIFSSIIIIAAAAMTIASCQKVENVGGNDASTVKVSVRASAQDLNVDTKTYIGTYEGQENTIIWGKGEQMIIALLAETSQIVSSASTDLFNGDNEAMFEFEILPEKEADSYIYGGIYPASAAISSTNEKVESYKVELPATQNASASSYDPAAYIMVARPESFNDFQTEWIASYRRATALNKITLSGIAEDIVSVEITAPTDVFLAGRRYIDLTTGNSGDIYYSQSNSVKINYEAALSGAKKDVWFTSWQATIPSGAQLTIKAVSSARSYTRTITAREAGIVFNEGNLNTLSVNMAADDVIIEDLVSLEGNYIIVSRHFDDKGNPSGNWVAMTGTLSTTSTKYYLCDNTDISASDAIDVTASNVSFPGVNDYWVVEKNGNNYSIKNAATQKYISYLDNSTNSAAESDNAYVLSIFPVSETSGMYTIASVATPTRELRYNGSSPRFAFYGGTQNKIYLIPYVSTPYLKASADKTNVDAVGGKITVTVDTNVDGWKVASDNEAFVVGDKSGNTVPVVVSANESTTDTRSAKITVSAEGVESVVITLTQDAKSDGGQGGSSTVHLDGSGLTSTATTAETTKTQDGITYVLSSGAKSQGSSSATNAFTTSPSILIGKSGAYIYNSTPLGKKITGFKIYANAGASAKVSVSVTFGTQMNPEGTAQYSATLSTLNSVYDCSDKIPANANYFVYKVTNANNSQVQFEITYEN